MALDLIVWLYPYPEAQEKPWFHLLDNLKAASYCVRPTECCQYQIKHRLQKTWGAVQLLWVSNQRVKQPTHREAVATEGEQFLCYDRSVTAFLTFFLQPSWMDTGCLLPWILCCLHQHASLDLVAPSCLGKVQRSWRSSLHSLAVNCKIPSLPYPENQGSPQHTVLPNWANPQLTGFTTGVRHNVAPGRPWTYKHLRLDLNFWS